MNPEQTPKNPAPDAPRQDGPLAENQPADLWQAEQEPEPEYTGEPEISKTRKRGSIAINILLCVCILGLAGAILGYFLSTKEYRVASREYKALANSYVQPQGEEKEGRKLVDFAALRRVNPEFVGWLDIPGTSLSYPVAQNPDNNYYISRTFEQTYNPSGAVFLDAGAPPAMDGVNSLLYGHNMKDGSMFATVQKYCTIPSFQQQHPNIYFYTEDATLVYEVFALRQTTIEDGAYQTRFGSENAGTAFLRQMSETLLPDDKILTLSTCVNDGDPQTPHRYIVQAVLRETLPAAKALPLPGSGT